MHCKLPGLFGVLILSLLVTLPLSPAMAQKAQVTAYPAIGKGARLFITKTHPAHGDLNDADFRQIADAGFTVAVNLWASDLPPIITRAAGAGLSSMNWNLGLVDKKDESDNTVTRQGKATRYTTPYSPRAWQEVTAMVQDLAKLSIEYPSFQGVALDFEIYDSANLDGFCESYDEQTFRAFLQSNGTAVPNPLPAPDQRWEWLHKKSLLQLYIGYQIDLVAARAREFRKAIDAVNPRFQIGVYGWGVLVPPVTHAVATAQAPALILDATAYGRTIYPYDAKQPDREGLKWTTTTLSQIREEAYNRYDNVVFLGGHYPHAPGPDDGMQFKFTAKQAFNSAAYGDGYWIWTDWETPKPWTDRRQWYDAMLDYFRVANAALDAGDWMWAAREPETVPSAKTSQPQKLVVGEGATKTAWDVRLGKKLSDTATQLPDAKAQTSLQNETYEFRINGSVVEASPKATPNGALAKRYPAGHALCALAIGDADGLPGAELVTLNAGWVKVWDIESQALLARFYVGTGQKSLAFAG